eukprot:TRINITY_DN38741_c0_g1_i1.p2 TRINITY_DN38741_c0_g1~~TRINITY_DN38741_c0_g1_i1.p2  ORF type:complete len:230 (-),score=65.66 TRINITY_DN38741_c0_g1_i1:72-761(-)
MLRSLVGSEMCIRDRMFTMVFSLGYLIGLLSLGTWFVNVDYRTKYKLIYALYATCIFSLTLLALVSDDTVIKHQTARVVMEGFCVLVMALTNGVQYYLIPSAYAAKYGAGNTGMVSAWLDGIGYASTVVLYPILGIVVDHVSWQPIWVVLALIQVVGAWLLLKLLPALYLVAVETKESYHAELGHGAHDHDTQLTCLLYTSDAADEEDSVDLGGRRIIKKKKNKKEVDK